MARKIELVTVNANSGHYFVEYSSGALKSYTDKNVPSTVIKFIQKGYSDAIAISSAIKEYIA